MSSLTIHVTFDLEHFFMIELMESEWNLLLQTVQALLFRLQLLLFNWIMNDIMNVIISCTIVALISAQCLKLHICLIVAHLFYCQLQVWLMALKS